MELIKSDNYTAIAGGTMGAIARPYVAGKRNAYKKGEFTILEFIPYLDIKQDHTIYYIVKGFADNDVLRFEKAIDWNAVAEKVNDVRNNELNTIKSTDLKNAIEFMKENEVGFIKFMGHMQDNNGLSKPLAFLQVIKDFYADNSHIFTIEVIAKIMIKYGYDFKSLQEMRELYYK